MVLGAAGLACFVSASGPSPDAATRSSAQRRIDSAASRYIQNAGQWNSKGEFLSRSAGLNVWLTQDGFTLDQYRIKSGKMKTGLGHAIGVKLVGANPISYRGLKESRLITDFIGSHASHRAKSYGEVMGSGAYAGIQVRHYFQDNRPRYDFIVAPKADPSQIRMRFAGASSVSVNGNALRLGTSLGGIPISNLFAYQEVNGKRRHVSASFEKVDGNTVRFRVGSYDPNQKLVIDPLIYGTYYGGDDGIDEVHAAVSDGKGGTYVTGYTQAAQFPSIYGPYGFTVKGTDAFVSKLQGDAYAHDYAAYLGGSGEDLGQGIQIDPFGDVWVAGRTYSPDFPGNTKDNTQFLRLTAGTATTGTFRLRYAGRTSSALSYSATTAQVQAALVTLLGNSNVAVTSDGGTLNQGGTYRITAPYTLSGNLSVTGATFATGTYSFLPRTSDIFVIRFQQSSSKVLDPLSSPATLIFGGDQSEYFANFSVVPVTSPTTSTPVTFAFAGNVIPAVSGLSSDLPEIPGTSTGSYLAYYTFNRSTLTFTKNTAVSRWLEGGDSLDITGLAVDQQGSAYVAGTVYFDGNYDTALANPPFITTPGVWAEGRLLRNNDIFARKYNSAGTMIYSTLIGGNNYDSAGGWDLDVDGTWHNTGSCIAVDRNLNAYVVGISNSFNFPRTRGVFGEIFDSRRNVTITKLNFDASQLVYSTNLNTNGVINPAGVAVDTVGNAYITGNAHPTYIDFPDSAAGGNPASAGDPNEPSSQPLGSIPVSSDALDSAWAFPSGQRATTEGFLIALNSLATSALYSGYIGGDLDETVYAPYVDQIGDVWVVGWTDVARIYSVAASGGTVTVRSSTASLGGLINSLAFKQSPDAFGLTTLLERWGNETSLGTSYTARNWSPGDSKPPSIAVPFKNMSVQRDGFIIKQRIGFASVAGITLAPTSAPGGLGVTTTATVTLSQAAPAGGAEVTVDLSGTGASFSNTATVTSTTVTVAAGATTATVTIFTTPVTATSTVTVKATYLGSFQARQLSVIPWLQGFTISTSEIVGGNGLTGRISLAAPAPTGGVTVSLSSDPAGLVGFATDTVTVPAGQTTLAFPITTKGVAAKTTVAVTAAALGVNRSANLTLGTAGLKTLTFAPVQVAGGTKTVGTLTLDGLAGSDQTVALSGLPSTYTYPATVTIPSGSSSTTFNVVTPIETVRVDRTVTATRAASGDYLLSTTSGSFSVLPATVKSLTLSTTTIAAGGSATATVELSAPAPEGGVDVEITYTPTAAATMVSTVNIPTGAATATFKITGNYLPKDTTLTVAARRGSSNVVRATATVTAAPFTISVDPISILGGKAAAGTVTIDGAAAVGGYRVYLTSSDKSVGVPSSVTIPAGSTSVTFLISTTTVATNKNVTITGTTNSSGSTTGVSASADMTVRANGVESFTITPSKVKGGSTTPVTLTITLEAVTTEDITIPITYSNSAPFVTPPASVVIKAGTRVGTATLRTRRVSRDQTVTITVSAPGSDLAGAVTVIR